MALKTRMKKYQPHIVYGILSLAIMLPLLKPGFVLTLDMVFTPHIRMPSDVTSSYLFYTLLHLLNVIVPSDVLQKVMLLTIPYLSGWGMYRLVQYVHDKQTRDPDSINWGAYVGGLFYAVNPFVYSRFMAGQFAVLLGYSLLPFAVHGLLVLLQRPNWRNSIVLGVWLTLIGIVSIHTLGSIAVLLAIAILLLVWRNRHHGDQLLRTLKFLGLSLALMVVLSGYWLVPLVLGHGATAQALNGFTSGDQQAFETLGGSPIGRLANVLRLQGFWAEGHDLFRMPQAHMIGWGLIVLALWLLIAVGVRNAWRRHERFIVVLLTASAGVGVLLAIDVANTALGNVLPFFSGFREPQKFVALVALAYAFFAGQGVNALRSYYIYADQWTRATVALAVALLLPILITPTMFWGFGGQLQSHQYPVTWVAMNERLNKDHANYNVLFLPWHLYMYYGFVGRITASPATNYFDKPMIVSNQMELKDASPTSIDSRKTLLSNTILPKAGTGTHLGIQLAPLRIKYVLLDKDDDYLKYAYLNHQTDLRLLTNNANFVLYQNMAYRSTP
jgi:hypothetical protein